jgi:hypothetical protein
MEKSAHFFCYNLYQGIWVTILVTAMSRGVNDNSTFWSINIAYHVPRCLKEVKEGSTRETLGAVKFICKNFWTDVFSKQVNKLQTNNIV